MSLIEILVGVMIGMIGIVVIFQVLQVSEERKRTTGAGSDAQISGSVGMFNLNRDLMLAGYGFGVAPNPQMGCNVQAYDALRATPNFTFRLSPVVITDGAGGAPDIITVLYGNSSMVAVSQTYDTATATTKHTQGRSGFQKGDVVVIATTAPVCALAQITDNTNSDGVSVDHASGTYTNFYTNASTSARYNPAGSPITSGQGFLYNLGPTPRRNIWSIQGDKLVYTDDLHSTDGTVEIATGVIDLQAQYGIDGTNGCLVDGQIASPGPGCALGEWTVTAPADWTKVRALRVAILARSMQYERQDPISGRYPTETNPSWAAGDFVMKNLDGSAGSTTPTDPTQYWKSYRYRVYQVVIPMKNMIWGTL